jgi:hypothetical protein
MHQPKLRSWPTALRDQRCVPLDEMAAWEGAILWALNQDTIDPGFQNGQWYARQQQVGEACRRLRQQGYEVTVGAYGPQLSAKSCHAIQGKIDRLVSLVGGVETLSQVCQVLKDQNLIHDGMWLFGDQVPGVFQTKFPTLPYGWLFSLGLKHAGRPSSPRKPAIAWKTLATLAIDYTASLDCQRYSQYEEFNLHPSAFHRTLRDTLIWREVFTLPQVPAQVVTRIVAILRDELTPADQAQLGVRIDALFGEIEAVLAGSADDRPTVRPREATERQLPTLWPTGERNGRTSQPILPRPANGQHPQSRRAYPVRTRAAAGADAPAFHCSRGCLRDGVQADLGETRTEARFRHRR